MCVFKNEKYCKIILDSLDYCCQEKDLYLFGLVMMLHQIHRKYSSARNWFCDNHSVLSLDKFVRFGEQQGQISLSIGRPGRISRAIIFINSKFNGNPK